MKDDFATLKEQVEALRSEVAELRRCGMRDNERRNLRHRTKAGRAGLGLAGLLVVLAASAWAATISVPHTFTNGTIADADEVNANFDVLVTELNDQDTRIGNLEVIVGTLGTVTLVGTGLGLTGGPITSAGTISIEQSLVPFKNTANTFTGTQVFAVGPSFVAAGAPFIVSSTTKVTNLNADFLDGLNSSNFALAGHVHP